MLTENKNEINAASSVILSERSNVIDLLSSLKVLVYELLYSLVSARGTFQIQKARLGVRVSAIVLLQKDFGDVIRQVKLNIISIEIPGERDEATI